MKRSEIKRRKAMPMRSRGIKRGKGCGLDWQAGRDRALEAANHWPTCHEHGLHPGEMCEGGIEVHHRLPRSGGGSHDLDNLLVICSKAHRYIHAHPAESYERGWLLKRSAA